MILTLWWLNEVTLVTIGDAIQSFIRNPDPSTRGCCLLSKKSIKVLWRKPARERSPQRFRRTGRAAWFHAVSRRRWLCSLGLYVVVIAIPSAFAGVIKNRLGSHSDPGKKNNAFGKVDVSKLNIALPPQENSLTMFQAFSSMSTFRSVISPSFHTCCWRTCRKQSSVLFTSRTMDYSVLCWPIENGQGTQSNAPLCA